MQSLTHTALEEVSVLCQSMAGSTSPEGIVREDPKVLPGHVGGAEEDFEFRV